VGKEVKIKKKNPVDKETRHHRSTWGDANPRVQKKSKGGDPNPQWRGGGKSSLERRCRGRAFGEEGTMDMKKKKSHWRGSSQRVHKGGESEKTRGGEDGMS